MCHGLGSGLTIRPTLCHRRPARKRTQSLPACAGSKPFTPGTRAARGPQDDIGRTQEKIFRKIFPACGPHIIGQRTTTTARSI
jgi:hypothetical protein